MWVWVKGLGMVVEFQIMAMVNAGVGFQTECISVGGVVCAGVGEGL